MEYLIRSILLLGFLAGLIFCIGLLDSEKQGNMELFKYDTDTRFVVIGVKVIWDEASILCKAKRARLAVLDTGDKARFVGRMLGEISPPFEDIWIGGFKRGSIFYWTNNRPVNASVMQGTVKPGDFPVWPEDPYLNASNRKCLAVDRHGHENPLFVNIRCVLKRAFICEFNTSDTCVTPQVPNVTDNYIHYFLFHGSHTWGQAVYECRRMGLMLAILDDTKLIRLMASRMLRTRPVIERAWIGGHHTGINWLWLGSGQLIDTNTYTTEMSETDEYLEETSEDDIDEEDIRTPPDEDEDEVEDEDEDDKEEKFRTDDDEGDYDVQQGSSGPPYPPWRRIPPLKYGCLMLDRHTCNYPTFIEEICERKRNFICQTDIKKEDSDPDIVEISSIFSLSKVKKTWKGALKSCAEYYKTGTLVTLDEGSDKGHAFLNEMMRSMINHLWQEVRSLWIGGKRMMVDKSKREKRWKWVGIDQEIANQTQEERDKNVNYTMYPPWAPKVKDDHDFDCLSLDRENHLQMFMYGLQCNQEQHYACQHEKGEKPLKSTYGMGGRNYRFPPRKRVTGKQRSDKARRAMEAGTTAEMTVESVLPTSPSDVLSTTPAIIGNNTDTD